MHHDQRSGPFLTVLTRFHVFGRVYAPQHPWRANPSTFAPQMCFLCLLPTSSCVGWVSGSPNQNHHFTPYSRAMSWAVLSKFVENLLRPAEICTKKFARFENKS